MVKNTENELSKDHILVCLSSSPSNERIVRMAGKMAQAFCGSLTALYVQTPGDTVMNTADMSRLQANMRLAQQLGAEIVTTHGEDVPTQIAEYALLSDVTKIVIGRSGVQRPHFWSEPTLTERLIALAPDVDIYIIPDVEAYKSYRRKRLISIRPAFPTALELLLTVGILVAATIIGWGFLRLGFANANIMTVFVFAVQLIAVLTNHRAYSMIAAVLSVLIFNFLFTKPRYTFHAYGEGYPVTFLIMFGIAFLTGTLALKLKNQAKQSEMVAFRTKILFDTNQILQCARGREEIISKTGQQLRKLLGRNVIFYSVKDHELEKSKVFMMEDREWSEQQKLKKEKYVAEWVLKHRKRAGAGTGNFPGAECLYLTVGVNETVYGVLGISIEKKQLESFEKSILQAIIGECALALENEQITIEKEKAAILAKNEQLRSNLLRAISHDLRTPLTSISGNASNLLSNADYFDKETKKQLYLDIYDDSMWLINLIENMLSVTRLEEGRMNLNISVELVDDVIQEALRHVDRKKDEHTITVEHEDELLLARMDSRLIVQMVINLVDNAIKYTQKGSHIDIRTGREGKNAVISVADDGPGISDEMKEHIFETFYTGTNKIADSRRSLGLGLALCKSIVNVHGGEIKVSDAHPHGAVFQFTLPAGEVYLYEQTTDTGCGR
mgnify:FL=1